MSIPWELLRQDFPALKRYVYLNAAAASPTPRQVGQAVAGFYQQLEEGGDLYWDEWLERREQVRRRAASFVGADPDEIAFVANTSAGMNLIADLLASDGALLTNEMEFPTVTIPWIHRGTSVHLLPAVEGIVRLESFAPEHAPRAATIAVSHVQYSNGFRQDLDALGRIKGDRRLVVCGSQAVGAFPVDVRRSGIDALATAGHKWLCAGYGAGFVYVGRDVIETRLPREIGWLSVQDPFAFDNRSYEILSSNRRSEPGCPPFGAIFALGAALEYLSDIGIPAIAERVLGLNMYLTTRLERAGFPVLSPGGEHRSAQTLCAVPEPPRAVAFLKERGILVTEKPQGIRIATHFYNSEEDVDACVDALTAYRESIPSL